MIGTIFKMLSPVVGNFMSNRQEISKAKVQAKIARLSNGIPGYSDEVLIFIWSAPFVLSFIPGLQEYAKIGFDHLAELPQWYVGGFVTITFSVFGIDKLFSMKK